MVLSGRSARHGIFGFCRWRDVEDEVWEGETIWMRGEVSDARLLALANPDAELSEREAAIWHRHLAHWTNQSDLAAFAVLIPVRLAGKAIDGYAVFIVGQSHPYAKPRFEGAFATREEAIHHLENEGALAIAHPGRVRIAAASLHCQRVRPESVF